VVDRDIDNFELGNGMPGVRVTGKVTTGSQSQTTAPHDFLLIADGSSEVQQMTAPVSDDGSFEFLRIPLTAANGVTLRVTTANGYPVGSIQLPKGERDVSGVEIPLSFVALVSGQVVVEGASANNIFNLPETAAQILALAIRSGPARPPDPRLPMFLEGGIGGRMSVRTAAPLGGVFRLLIPPGRYDLGLRNVPDGYRVQSMTAGATDLLSSPLEVRDDAPVAAIRIVLAPAPDAESGPISGQILNWDGTPAISVAVAVAPANPPNLQLMKGSIAGVMQTDSAGRYRFDNIPPGRYVVAAGMPMFSGETVEPPVISAPTFYPGVADRPNATIIVFGGATAAPELRFRLTHPASPIPLFSAQGKVTGMTAANLNVISAARGGPWPGRTNLQVLFFSHPGTGVFPPVRGNSNSVLLNCGAREPGRLVNGPELLHLEGLGHVTPDGFYEVRNLPAGRYRACLPSGLGALTVDDIRVGPSNAIANFDLGPAPQAGPRGARGN
jgi:hypothetical protein